MHLNQANPTVSNEESDSPRDSGEKLDKLEENKMNEPKDEVVTIKPLRSVRKSRLRPQPKKGKGFEHKNKVTVYDHQGRLRNNGLDLCDCLAQDCPGCHFPCPKCSSPKCGSECRVNRKWQYETKELDGVPSSLIRNPHLVRRKC